jgi:RNA polymerase sigma-70 factor, ECF subfamily
MPDPANHDFGAYRNYLKVLALSRISVDLRGRIDPSDVVQEALCDAIRNLNGHPNPTQAEMMAWLREILCHRLIDRFRRFRLEDRVKSLDGLLEQTSAGMSHLLRASQPAPDDQAIADEEAKFLKEMLESTLGQLTEAQAEAIVLKHCQGMSVAEISRHMNRTPAAVGGLLRHGMHELRQLCDGRIEP